MIDAEVGRVVQAADAIGAETVILSEYGISEVSQPVHLNRLLRESGDLVVRREPLGWETLDCGASKASAVADHQVAHIYVRRDEDLSRVNKLLQSTHGIERVLDRSEQAEFGIDHPRSGELVAVAQPGCWFTYYFWQDDSLAPDYARTVDIHRKPGYDPVELFVDPNLKWPQLRIVGRLLQKKLGFRIGRLCAQALPHNCSMILNIGTTSESVARELLNHRLDHRGHQQHERGQYPCGQSILRNHAGRGGAAPVGRRVGGRSDIGIHGAVQG